MLASDSSKQQLSDGSILRPNLFSVPELQNPRRDDITPSQTEQQVGSISTSEKEKVELKRRRRRRRKRSLDALYMVLSFVLMFLPDGNDQATAAAALLKD